MPIEPRRPEKRPEKKVPERKPFIPKREREVPIVLDHIVNLSEKEFGEHLGYIRTRIAELEKAEAERKLSLKEDLLLKELRDAEFKFEVAQKVRDAKKSK